MAVTPKSKRLGDTQSLGGYLATERERIFDGASERRRAQMVAAERSRDVYRAWNTVCGGTLEGSHATGLHYVPEQNELIVYMDAASWATEMTVLREIIRARMAAAGASVDALVFKTSREGYESAAMRGRMHPAQPKREKKRPRPLPLAPAEEEALEREVSPIEDDRLKQALKSAMEASLCAQKGAKAQNEP